jgi:antitoxin MazE
MEAIIRKWGNSPAVRLPAALMKSAALELEQKVNVSVVKGRIIIEPVGKVEYKLADLVGAMTPANAHGEVDFGPARGKEAF